MKPKDYVFKIGRTDEELTLMDFLAREIPAAVGAALSRSKIRGLIVAGAVYVDGRRIQRPGLTLRTSMTVKTFIDLRKLQSDNASKQKKVRLTGADIAYEDDEIVVVNKPAGLPTQATVDDNRDHLYAAIKRHLSERESAGTKRVEEPYVGLHHRLDYDTSGLIIFTKMKSANRWVSDLFKNREVSKTYHAVAKTAGRSPGGSWEIKNHLARAKNKGGGKVIHMEEVRSGGDFAHTEFRILKNLPGGLQLVECRPHTGRTHQIRVHLMKSGQPILGDILYGGEKSIRIFLHSKTLDFMHGGRDERLTIDSEYPAEFKKLLV